MCHSGVYWVMVLISQWGSAIRCVLSHVSQHQSRYDLKCYQDIKLQQQQLLHSSNSQAHCSILCTLFHRSIFYNQPMVSAHDVTTLVYCGDSSGESSRRRRVMATFDFRSPFAVRAWRWVIEPNLTLRAVSIFDANFRLRSVTPTV